MVQVDVFWSYGLASGLTLAAGKQIRKKETPMWVSPYFIGVLLWIALLFAPSGLYLLWNFPYWETMFLAEKHTDIPAWLTSVFAITNVTQGMLGYYVTAKLIKNGKSFAAKMQTVWSHACMIFILAFGWDGSGWKRFTYAGTGEEWRAGTEYAWTAFFSSPVFYTLLGMAVFFVPSYVWLIFKWRREGAETRELRGDFSAAQLV